MDDFILNIEHISKEYCLGTIGRGTLRGDLQSWMARILGKEDPNSVIGSDLRTRHAERFLALDDVSFGVRKGEALGIIGHNGAGKSTLLKLLCRITAPTNGRISYRGRITSMLEVGTGFHPELTGRENVYMNGAILGMKKSEIHRRYDEIVRFAEMERFIDTPVKRYSSGMYVKLAFAVAAHLDSDILIMDEVLAVGDMDFQKKCLKRMREVAEEEGKTILYVSHNMRTIRELCDRCIVLDRGKLIYDGTVEKAIGIYTGLREVFKHRYRYSEEMHAHGARKQVLIVGVTFEPSFSGKCSSMDEVDFLLEGTAAARFERLRFHFELEASDGIIVGSMFADREVVVQPGERFSVPMTLIFSGLAPDCYVFHAVAETVESYESYAWQDTVFNAFVIEVTANPKEQMISEWKTKTWGHVKLGDVRIGNRRW